MRIWIDADACPKAIKEVVYKAAMRLQIPVTLVANSYLTVPPGPLFNAVQVDKGDDKADQYIVDQVKPQQLVITADIPLAALVVEKGAVAINPRGELYTADNVREHLSYRGFMQDLRSSGMVTGGPASLGPKDKEMFANALNKYLTANQKK